MVDTSMSTRNSAKRLSGDPLNDPSLLRATLNKLNTVAEQLQGNVDQSSPKKKSEVRYTSTREDKKSTGQVNGQNRLRVQSHNVVKHQQRYSEDSPRKVPTKVDKNTRALKTSTQEAADTPSALTKENSRATFPTKDVSRSVGNTVALRGDTGSSASMASSTVTDTQGQKWLRARSQTQRNVNPTMGQKASKSVSRHSTSSGGRNSPVEVIGNDLPSCAEKESVSGSQGTDKENVDVAVTDPPVEGLASTPSRKSINPKRSSVGGTPTRLSKRQQSAEGRSTNAHSNARIPSSPVKTSLRSETQLNHQRRSRSQHSPSKRAPASSPLKSTTTRPSTQKLPHVPQPTNQTNGNLRLANPQDHNFTQLQGQPVFVRKKDGSRVQCGAYTNSSPTGNENECRGALWGT
eukprot:gb/GECG01002039.1/.p1 GENE.gb/GECG01002039.1/~~gb/GECG01002039.1/.p1  ORF type:complete len:405 (+),score=51.49 gb/GECG01002039.1/:1-1215(+)